MNDAITKFDGEFEFLSNFWLCWVEFEGHTYASSEHAYQAAKTLAPSMREMIRLTTTPGRAKRAGQILTIRPDWNEVRIPCMEAILVSKFKSVALAARLLATGDRQIVEGNYWGDTFWGVCKGKGENNLGKLLMKIRSTL